MWIWRVREREREEKRGETLEILTLGRDVGQCLGSCVGDRY
jgi:hypothetical protein